MATLPHLHTPRLSFPGSRVRARTVGLPATARADAPASQQQRASDAVVDDSRPSRAASIVPVVVSLAGLFALALGTAYVGREVLEVMTRLFSGS